MFYLSERSIMPGLALNVGVVSAMFSLARATIFAAALSLLLAPCSPADAAAPEKSSSTAKSIPPAKTAAAGKPADAAKAAGAAAGAKNQPAPPAKASGPAAPGWELEQWHRMAGRMRLVSNKYGGRFETTHYTLLKPLPGDKMYFLNQQTKRYACFPVNTWRKKFNFYHKDSARTRDAGFTEFSPWKHIGNEKIAGLRVGRYSRMRTNKLPPPNDKTYTEEWSFCPDLKIPSALVELYKKTLYMTFDDKLGFPMRIKEIREWSGKKAKKVDVSYDTIGYKKASFPQSFFAMSPDYKQVKDEMSVLMDEGGDMMGGDMMGGGDTSLGGLGINEELKKRLK